MAPIQRSLQKNSEKNVRLSKRDRGKHYFAPKTVKDIAGADKTLKNLYKTLGLSKRQCKEAIHHHSIEFLNQRQSWTPIVKEMVLTMDGKETPVKSEMVPMNASVASSTVSIDGKETARITGDGFNDRGLTAHCCHDFTNTSGYLTNSHLTEASVGGKTVFRAVRHGVLSAKGVKDDSERKAGNLANAKDLVKGCLVQQLEALRSANPTKFADVCKTGHFGQLNITSTSLLTPDSIRPGFNERKMLMDQFEALAAAEGIQNIDVEIDGQKVSLECNVDIAAFNYGVNEGPMIPLLKLGREFEAKFNERAIQKLQGRVLDFEASIMEPGPDGELQVKEGVSIKEQNDRIVARQLFEDVQARILGAKSSKNPYEVPVRLLNLAEIMRDGKAFNCKSGKDRTGMVDAEAKHFAVKMQQLREKFGDDQLLNTGPGYESFLPDDMLSHSGSDSVEITNAQTMLLESGNLEVQQVNTMGQGYKLKGIGGVFKRIEGVLAKRFGQDAYVMARGISAFFKS